VLSKGLVGLVLPLLIVALYALASGGRAGGLFAIRHSLFASPVAPLLFLALTLPWYLAAAWQNPGFLEFHIVDNQLFRFLGDWSRVEDEIPVTTGAFAASILLWFLPWSLFIVPSLRYGFVGPSPNLRPLAGAWAAAAIGFFSLSALKLEHYFIPAIPPLSLMTGGLWRKAFASPRSDGTGLKWCLGLGSIGFALVGAGIVGYADSLTPAKLLAGLAQLNVYYRILQSQGAEFPYASTAPLIQLLKLLGWVLLAGVPLSFFFLRLRMIQASFAAMLCVAGLLAALVFAVLRLTEPYHSTRSLAADLKSRAGGARIVHEGPLEYSGGLPFYTGRRIQVLNGKRGSLEFGSGYPDARHLFLGDAEFSSLWNGQERIFLITGAPVREPILDRLPKESVSFLGQYGLRRLYTNGER
jgi:hypothetical protein